MQARKPEHPELLNRQQAAKYLGVAEQTLAIWHSTGRYSLPVVKVGRLVKYRREELERFLRNNTMAKGQRPQHDPKPKDPAARDAAKEVHWRALLATWKQTKLNVREFCRKEGIREAQFYSWRREIRLRDREVSDGTPDPEPAKTNPFVPLRVVAEQLPDDRSPACMEILLPGGAKIVLKPDSSLELVAKLLAEIERVKC